MAQQPWEPYEEQFLREVGGYMSRETIADKLERTPNAIKNRARMLGVSLASERITTAWKPEETALFDSHSDKEISQITGRSARSVASKRYQLKIYRRAA